MKEVKTQKPKPVVTVRIMSGPTTPARKQAWRKFWQKLIAEVTQSEAKHG